MLAYAVDLVLIAVLAIIVILALVRTTSIFVSVAGQVADAVTGVDAQRDREVIEQFLLLAAIAAVLTQLVCEIAYFTFWETTRRGQSPGKRLFHLRVVGDEGSPLTLLQSLARNLLRMVDVLPTNYIVGLLTMLNSRHGKRLGDIVAGTVVIRLDRPPPVAEVSDRPEDTDESFVFDLGQLARMGTTETTLVRQTLRRLATLTPEEQDRVLQNVVEALGSRLGYRAVERGQRAAFLRALHRAVAMHG